MALQLSGTVRDNEINQIESTIGVSPTLTIFAGTKPANCAAADAGTALAIVTLPSDWLTASTGGAGQVTKTGGVWQDSSADATGTASYFRVKAGATCHIQGDVGLNPPGTADMIVDNLSFNAGQSFTINSFSITMGNA
jgi:hypothetical protein